MQQYSTIDIICIALVVAAVVLGACALFSGPVWRWFLLAAGLFSALAAMAVGINAEWLAALDVSVEKWFEAHRSRRGLIDARGIFRFVGSPMHVAGAAVVCGTLLSLRARSAIPVFLVVGGVGFGVVVERVFKAMVGRTSTAVAELQGRSNLLHFEHAFPSGHVTGSAALLGMIAVCLGMGRSRAVRIALTVPAVAGVLLVAFVAVYAKPHTFTDVVGGMLLGGAIVSLGAAVLGATNYSPRASAAAPANGPSPPLA
ncbi:MAG: phosphatase PAP2 family protein [Actinomycetia bacterium]|nr:phosphatase PAP2 family protein [Actinomycetes bacterium]